MLTLCSLLDGIISFRICYLVRWHSVDFMLDASTNSTYTPTNWKWWFERNQLQNECKYKNVGPTPPVCTKKILAGNLYCSPSPPHFVAEIWRWIVLSSPWSVLVWETPRTPFLGRSSWERIIKTRWMQSLPMRLNSCDKYYGQFIPMFSNLEKKNCFNTDSPWLYNLDQHEPTWIHLL